MDTLEFFWNEKADSLAKDVTKKRGKEKRRTKNKINKIIDIHNIFLKNCNFLER